MNTAKKSLALGTISLLANLSQADSIPENTTTNSATTTPKIVINPETRQFNDEYGRAVLFHGQNAVYKVDPYIPDTVNFDPQNSLNDTDIANLAKWGQNFMRLGVMWEGVERTENVYDEVYLDRIEALINKMGQAGIYTLVDAHQDAFARASCGEGVPDFYAKMADKHPHCISLLADKVLAPIYNKLGVCADMRDFGYQQDENGDYLISDCLKRGFWEYYSTK